MDKQINIYIVTHKKFNPPHLNNYTPIQVGFGENLGYLRDNIGDNISNKNASFCELTAAYWIWKNDNTKYVGLTHYRRYFFNNIISSKEKNILTSDQAINYLKKYDIIVPRKLYIYNDTNWTHYQKNYHINDLKECRNIISSSCPDYLNSFDKVMNSHALIRCNMMICSKMIWNDYHRWLFDILFTLDNRIDISNYDNYNKRVFGFLAERLFNVWIEYQDDLKIKYLPIFSVQKYGPKEEIKNQIRYCTLKLQRKV